MTQDGGDTQYPPSKSNQRIALGEHAHSSSLQLEQELSRPVPVLTADILASKQTRDSPTQVFIHPFPLGL